MRSDAIRAGRTNREETQLCGAAATRWKTEASAARGCRRGQLGSVNGPACVCWEMSLIAYRYVLTRVTRPTRWWRYVIPMYAHTIRANLHCPPLRDQASPHPHESCPRRFLGLGGLFGVPIKWILFDRSESHESNYTPTDVLAIVRSCSSSIR